MDNHTITGEREGERERKEREGERERKEKEGERRGILIL